MDFIRYFTKFFFLFVYSFNCYSAVKLPALLTGVNLETGSEIQLNLEKSKLGTVVAFLSVKCPCSNSHEAVLNQIAKDYSNAGFQFIGVHSNADESLSVARDHFKSSALSFPVIQDLDSKIADQFEAFKTPHVYIVSPKLEILFQGGVDNSKIAGMASQHYLKDALVALKYNQPLSEKNVRVLGCEIKRP